MVFMGISEPMHHTGPGTGRNKSLESHPIDFEDDDQSGFFCRICWYEEDEDEGGKLISPCKCSGTSKYVHTRCLTRWLAFSAEKGDSDLFRCELCLERYAVIPSIGMIRKMRYGLGMAWSSLLERPYIGRALKAFAGVATFYASTFACWSLAGHMLDYPRVLMDARKNPSALKPMIPHLVSAICMESIILTFDYMFHAETAVFYGLGWLLDALSRIVRENYVTKLSSRIQPLANLLVSVPMSIGVAIEAFELSILFLFGGTSHAFFEGITRAMVAPLLIISDVSKAAAKALTKLSRFGRVRS